jgi:hypothetical protein
VIIYEDFWITGCWIQGILLYWIGTLVMCQAQVQVLPVPVLGR